MQSSVIRGVLALRQLPQALYENVSRSEHFPLVSSSVSSHTLIFSHQSLSLLGPLVNLPSWALVSSRSIKKREVQQHAVMCEALITRRLLALCLNTACTLYVTVMLVSPSQTALYHLYICAKTVNG